MRWTLVLAAAAVTAVAAGCDIYPPKPATTPGTTTTTMPQAKNAFSGPLQVEFLTGGGEADRRVKLLKDFGFLDPTGVLWEVKAGFESDGASIPWGFWSFIGGPFDGPYRDAAIIHDKYCQEKTRPHEQVHRMFYDAAVARGVTERTAQLMYGGILIGGPSWPAPAPPAVPAITPAGGKSGALPMTRVRMGSLFAAARAQTTSQSLPPQTRPLTPEQIRQFEELRRWIEATKPTPEQIAQKVKEIQALSTVPAQPAPPK